MDYIRERTFFSFVVFLQRRSTVYIYQRRYPRVLQMCSLAFSLVFSSVRVRVLNSLCLRFSHTHIHTRARAEIRLHFRRRNFLMAARREWSRVIRRANCNRLLCCGRSRNVVTSQCPANVIAYGYSHRDVRDITDESRLLGDPAGNTLRVITRTDDT